MFKNTVILPAGGGPTEQALGRQAQADRQSGTKTRPARFRFICLWRCINTRQQERGAFITSSHLLHFDLVPLRAGALPLAGGAVHVSSYCTLIELTTLPLSLSYC